MKLAGKILVASAAALGMIGSGFAAWNYVSNGAAKVTQEVTPTTSGTVELQAELLDVTSSNKQLVLVPGSEQLGLSYNVKYKGSEFKGNEQLTVKVEANKDVSGYLSLPDEIEAGPSIWHSEENAATGYEVELDFAWVVGETKVTNLLAYAKEHYATTAAQQEFLTPYENAIEGVKFTITFDIEYGEPAEPVTPAATSIEAILVNESIEVDGTSALMVSDDLDVDYEPSEYTIVEKSDGFDGIVSYENGVFTGLAAGTASFKVQVGELKSEELTLTVTAKQSEEPTQEPTLSKIVEFLYGRPEEVSNNVYGTKLSDKTDDEVLAIAKGDVETNVLTDVSYSGSVATGSQDADYTGFKFKSPATLTLTFDSNAAIRKIEIDAIGWKESTKNIYASIKFDDDAPVAFANKDGTTVETFAKESDETIESITITATNRFVITAIRLYAFN